MLKNVLIWTVVAMVLMSVFNHFSSKGNQNSSRLNYSQFIEEVNLGQVSQVSIEGSTIRGAYNSGEAFTTYNPGDPGLMGDLLDNGVKVTAKPPEEQSVLMQIFISWFPMILLIAVWIFFMRSMGGGGMGGKGGPMSFGKSKARMLTDDQNKITMDDVAGADEAKEEVGEIVDFLRDPTKYQNLGGNIPRGVLMVGPPGTGKTLIAKAIAGEAKVPFFTISGSDFVEMFVGVGASRVRDMFEQAKAHAPCIIFIDEIDAVGRERGAGIGGGNDEREQTLNQLLTEMDGFKENKGVIVVGATNRADILDAALLRPGRFDRQITVGLPDRLGRLGILKVHARNKPLNQDVSLVQLANRTPGFSGADLANLLNESAILATRYKKTTISKNEVNEAADRIIGGIAGSAMEDTKNKKLIAYHEVGHAIVGSLLENHDEVEKVTLIPRGGAKGLTWFAPEEDQMLVSRSELLARIITTLGGRVAEKIVFGDPEITTGASNDLQQVTNIARQMVTRYGMSSIGPIALEDNNNEQIFVSGNEDAISDRIDAEVCKIVNHCEQVATKIVLDNRVIIDFIVEKLLDAETLTGEEFRELVKQYTIPPMKK